MRDRERVIELVGRLTPDDLELVRRLLDRLAAPVATLDELQAHCEAAPPDDEPVSVETAREIAEAHARWERQERQGVPHAEVKRRTMADRQR